MQHLEPFVDTHCHLLPGLDDGAADWDEALAMARLAVTDGISTTIVTPHQSSAHPHIDGPTVRARTAHLQDFLNRHGVPLDVRPGGELRIEPDLVQRIRRGELLTLADRGRYVLLELPHEVYLPIEGLLTQLRRAGLTGILAHAERNQGILAQPHLARAVVEAGCLIQVTATSLLGTFGPQVQQLADRLIDEGCVHVIASDAHSSQSRRPLIRRAFERILERAGYPTARLLCCTNPAAILTDKPLLSARSQPARKSAGLSGWFRWKKAS
ncbi:MAG: hypothetical protein JW818_12060 [Pirellulales bacterium]|nr:hypothetical protein [Pirellulales bacterium]